MPANLGPARFSGRVFKIEEHIEPLYHSLKYLRIDPRLSPIEMIGVSQEVSGRSHHLGWTGWLQGASGQQPLAVTRHLA